MPYTAQPQSPFGNVGQPSPEQPRVDVASIIDALTRSGTGLIQQTVLRKQRQQDMLLQSARAALEKNRFDLDKKTAEQSAIAQGFIHAYDKPVQVGGGTMPGVNLTPSAGVPTQGASVPTYAGAGGKIKKIMAPTDNALPQEKPRATAPTSLIQHVPEQYDPMAAGKIKQALALESVKQEGRENLAEIKAGQGMFKEFDVGGGKQVFYVRNDGTLARPARDENGDFITGGRPYSAGGKVWMWENGRSRQLGTSDSKSSAEKGLAAHEKLLADVDRKIAQNNTIIRSRSERSGADKAAARAANVELNKYRAAEVDSTRAYTRKVTGDTTKVTGDTTKLTPPAAPPTQAKTAISQAEWNGLKARGRSDNELKARFTVKK